MKVQLSEGGSMGTRNHQNRLALISRLEEKYSKKLAKLNSHQLLLSGATPATQGMRISQNQYIDYEVIGSA